MKDKKTIEQKAEQYDRDREINRQSVKKYHANQRQIIIRYDKRLDSMSDGFSLNDAIRQRAEELGQSVNTYILSLIENDLEINIKALTLKADQEGFTQ